MGFFSKTCAKTHLPIVSHYKDIPRLSEVVALLPNGKKFTGSYDGYGRVAGTGLDFHFWGAPDDCEGVGIDLLLDGADLHVHSATGRYGAAPLGRLVAETRRQGGVDSGGSASAKPIEAF